MASVKTVVSLAAGALAAWATVGVGWAQQAPTKTTGELTSISATVDKVDPKKRELTLKEPDGDSVIVSVPESVKGLEKVKPGDQVNVDYYQSVAMTLRKPGTAPMGTQTESFRQPGAGPMPGGVMGQQISGTVKVTKIDPARNQLMIRSPSGQEDTINVTDAQNRAELKKMKPGDEIQVTYSEAMAVSMTHKEKK